MHPLPQKLLYLWQQASDSSWSQCKAVLTEMISPCWVHSRGIPFECFFPPTTTKPCFSLSAHLSEYLLLIKIQQRTTKKITCARNHRVFQGESKQPRPLQSAGNHKTEMRSRSDVDLVAWSCVGWAQSTLLAFTGTVKCHKGKGSTTNWNEACSQSGLGSQPLFYSGRVTSF